MATYFGQQNISGAEDLGNVGISKWMSAVCPGSGNQIIKELSGWITSAGGGNFRLAIYSADRSTKIAEGAEEIEATDGWAWQGHLTQVSITPNPATLVGGTTYVIGESFDKNDPHTKCENKSSTYGYARADYTGGWPASLGDGTEEGAWLWAMRCGVDPEAGGGLSIPVAMDIYRQRRN